MKTVKKLILSGLVILAVPLALGLIVLAIAEPPAEATDEDVCEVYAFAISESEDEQALAMIAREVERRNLDCPTFVQAWAAEKQRILAAFEKSLSPSQRCLLERLDKAHTPEEILAVSQECGE